MSGKPSGQRSARAQSGPAFAQTSTDAFAYNAKGEVTSATNAALAARNQGFAYDQIGNRLTLTTTAGTTNYTSNGLNQYSSVNFVSSVVSPSYDHDGNQLTTGLGQAYVWDAENRLISVEPLVPTANSLKVINVYDSYSRRVRRTIFTFVNSTWVPSNDEKYIYEGWNVVAVYDASSALTLLRAYTWGVDLSGSRQGAGGVGGLLAVSEISNGQVSSSYHYAYDANGNVGQLLSNAAALVAHYEYDTFGGAIFTSGSYAGQNEYRFSTKPLDAASGLYYYGFRYYNPSTGRWPSRDPIEERGGVNLSVFVDNSPTVSWDFLGLSSADEFDNKSCALKDMFRMLHELSRNYNREYGGFVYEAPSGKWAYAIYKGDERTVDFPVPPNTTPVHVHPPASGSTRPSTADMAASEKANTYEYLVTAQGTVVQYIGGIKPDKNEVDVGGKSRQVTPKRCNDKCTHKVHP